MAESCVLWHRAISSNGYGAAWRDGRQMSAHRMIWEAVNGPIPAGLYVLHRCDVKACVNLDHLFLGTPLDNMRDKIAKGRARYVGPTKNRNGLRPCKACGEWKALSAYSPSGKYLHISCKPCRAAARGRM